VHTQPVDLRQLECFLAVAEELHVGRAGKRLHLAQPTVSQSVRRLEHELGGALFERTTRKVSLTPLGTAFYAEARAAYHRLEEAYASGRRLADGKDAEFVIGYSPDIGTRLFNALSAMETQFPNLRVMLTARGTHSQLQALKRRAIDIGLCWVPPQDDALDSAVIGECGFVAILPDDHPLAAGDAMTMSMLAGEALVCWPKASNPELYDRFATALGVDAALWTPAGVAIGYEDVSWHVRTRRGIGILLSTAAEGHSAEGLRHREIVDGPLIARSVVWHRNDRRPPVTAFVELMRSGMQPSGIGAVDSAH